MAYSYQYNLKIVGLPQTKAGETAVETVDLCVKLFNELSANINQQDIDIAHRLSRREESKPATIVCKFTRRVAKEVVLTKKKEIANIDLQKIVPTCSEETTVAIFEHLTPKKQDLLKQAKSFQRELNYAYCWVKNSEILIRESQDSKVIKIKKHSVLDGLRTTSSPVQSAWMFPPSGLFNGRGRGRGRGFFRSGQRTRSTNNHFS